MIDAIRRFFSVHSIRPCHLLVACSGGVDSTALLIALADLRAEGFRLTAGHVNHHLRDEESDGDEAFVRSLCETHGVPLQVVDGPLDPHSVRESGIESAARDVRHAKLRDAASAAGADYVATAHQLNDQAETILMRLMTGTGFAGLRGIHPVREDRWIRPLIEVPRGDIEAFLRERGVTPRIDRMNADPRFLRNRVRAVLNDFGSSAIENLAAIASQAQHIWPAIERTLDAVERSSTVITPDETRFIRWPDDPWLRQALLNRHIRRLGSSRDISSQDLERIASSVGDIRRISVTRELELVLRHGSILLRRIPDPATDFEIHIAPPATAFIGEISATITLNRVSTPVRDDTATGARRRSTQRFELPPDADERFVIRNRRPGDRFQPLGMKTDKKLKDFLIDRKIDAEIRDAIPLLVWKGEIVWVAGIEISERFKVTSPTGALYEVKLEHASRDEKNPEHIQR